MLHRRTMEAIVGVFMLAGILALVFLALKVSGLTHMVGGKNYQVTASFSNIGDLKVRAPVAIAGVRIGQVSGIELEPNTYEAKVTLTISDHYHDIPIDSSAQILTEGLLGSNYIGLTPGYANEFLHNGSVINSTHSALILENLIGQLLFKVNGGDEKPAAEKTS